MAALVVVLAQVGRANASVTGKVTAISVLGSGLELDGTQPYERSQLSPQVLKIRMQHMAAESRR
jgi:hypothetical protein